VKKTRVELDDPDMPSRRPSLVVSGSDRGKEPDMVEIPKAILVERIRSRSGPEAADSANDELPDKLDLDSDTDARLLRRYDLEPDELREEFGGGSPSTG
jgi:hypothetical protein